MDLLTIPSSENKYNVNVKHEVKDDRKYERPNCNSLTMKLFPGLIQITLNH